MQMADLHMGISCAEEGCAATESDALFWGNFTDGRALEGSRPGHLFGLESHSLNPEATMTSNPTHAYQELHMTLEKREQRIEI